MNDRRVGYRSGGTWTSRVRRGNGRLGWRGEPLGAVIHGLEQKQAANQNEDSAANFLVHCLSPFPLLPTDLRADRRRFDSTLVPQTLHKYERWCMCDSIAV